MHAVAPVGEYNIGLGPEVIHLLTIRQRTVNGAGARRMMTSRWTGRSLSATAAIRPVKDIRRAVTAAKIPIWFLWVQERTMPSTRWWTKHQRRNFSLATHARIDGFFFFCLMHVYIGNFFLLNFLNNINFHTITATDDTLISYYTVYLYTTRCTRKLPHILFFDPKKVTRTFRFPFWKHWIVSRVVTVVREILYSNCLR